MAIEIVSFPIKNGWIFYSYVSHYQRVEHPPCLWMIRANPILRNTTLPNPQVRFLKPRRALFLNLVVVLCVTIKPF